MEKVLVMWTGLYNDHTFYFGYKTYDSLTQWNDIYNKAILNIKKHGIIELNISLDKIVDFNNEKQLKEFIITSETDKDFNLLIDNLNCLVNNINPYEYLATYEDE